ncbi:MAG TPA: hypothetical protein VFI74_02485 [Candidatus Saccharimonadales bacterium]|nr:hypothetical protein [Candidatus Saccharimonadales bacterium]
MDPSSYNQPQTGTQPGAQAPGQAPYPGVPQNPAFAAPQQQTPAAGDMNNIQGEFVINQTPPQDTAVQAPQQYQDPTAQPQAPIQQPQATAPTEPQYTYPQETQATQQSPTAQQLQQQTPEVYQQPFQGVNLDSPAYAPQEQPAQPQTPVQQPQASIAGAPGAPGTTPVAGKTNPNSTQNTLQIAEIRDGIVIMNDGSFRSVVMVKSINFDLMSQVEQEAVEFSYQGFLNSLYFPIQIVIRSEKVDLQPYIEKLDKIRTEHDNMLLALLMNDYIGYIDQLAQQTNIMDKRFYIVVPYFPQVDVQKALTQSKTFLTGLASLFGNQEQHVVINEEDLEKAKTELRNRVQAVLSGLLQSNIQGLPLDTQELIELFYDSYNPDTATRQQLKNFDSLTADVITKGQGATVQPHMKTELN